MRAMIKIPFDGEAITGEVFDKFLGEKCGRLKCPACSYEGPAAIIAPSRDRPVRMFEVNREDGTGSLWHYLVSCEECGFTWFFAVEKVMQWAYENNFLKDDPDDEDNSRN